MVLRLLKLTTLAFLFSNVTSFASTCEGELLSAFERAPNDSKNGLVSDMVAINTSSLIEGYKRGLFAWKSDANGIGEWYNPPIRGILKLDQVHFSRRDLKYFRKQDESGELRVTFDKAFNEVIHACAAQKRRSGLWISETHIREYIKLHERGNAHSVEVWRGEELVAGLYGVYVNGVFSGESMFHYVSDATKLAYRALVERLKSRGHTFIDTQMNIGLSSKWGGEELPRYEYMRLVREAQAANLRF